MKLNPKDRESVIADLVGNILVLKEDMQELVEVVADRNEEVLEIKKQMAEMEEKLNRKIAERDQMIRSQAETIRALVERAKNGLIATQHNANGMKPKDLEYLAHLLIDNGYLEAQKPKNGIINKLFSRG
jgi:chromosome segregation ATPase